VGFDRLPLGHILVCLLCLLQIVYLLVQIEALLELVVGLRRPVRVLFLVVVVQVPLRSSVWLSVYHFARFRLVELNRVFVRLYQLVNLFFIFLTPHPQPHPNPRGVHSGIQVKIGFPFGVENLFPDVYCFGGVFLATPQKA